MEERKPILIIQSSHIRTGSTFLVNLLYGFIIPNERISFFINSHETTRTTNDNIQIKYDINKLEFNVYVLKSHELNFDSIMNTFSDNYNVYFVCSERGDLVIDAKYKQMNNVLTFDYDTELLETYENPLENIINNAYSKLKTFFPDNVILSKDGALTRIRNMNEFYETMKTKPFSLIDDFYELHGSHRSRDK